MKKSNSQKNNSTITDVARLAGVSVSTVSVVTNNKDKYVTEQLRNQVLSAVKELNYHPNSVARSLKIHETGTIGVVLTNISSPVTPTVVKTIQKIVTDKGMDMMIVSSEENKQLEINAVNNFISKRVDGLIICPVQSDNLDHIRYASEVANIPVVCIERTIPQDFNIPSVVTSNYETSKKAVEHLIFHQRKNIALLSMPVFGSNTSERIRGYTTALKEHGLYKKELIKETDYLGTTAYDITLDLINNQDVDAIFALSQSITFGAYKAIRASHRRIPDDISLIGYDSMDWMEIASPPVTTIRQPLIEMANTAAEMLLQNNDNHNHTDKNIVLPSEMIIRKSCGCS